MAKKLRAADVPGIFPKRKRLSLTSSDGTLTKEAVDEAEKLLDQWADRPTWRHQFDALGSQIERGVQSDQADVRKAAQYALHIWQCIQTELAKPKGKQRGPEWFVEWSMQLRWQIDKANLWPLDHIAAVGRATIENARNTAKATNEKRLAKRPDYMAKVRAIMDCGYKYHPACEQVAELLDCNERTVRSHTKELQPWRQPCK